MPTSAGIAKLILKTSQETSHQISKRNDPLTIEFINQVQSASLEELPNLISVYMGNPTPKELYTVMRQYPRIAAKMMDAGIPSLNSFMPKILSAAIIDSDPRGTDLANTMLGFPRLVDLSATTLAEKHLNYIMDGSTFESIFFTLKQNYGHRMTPQSTRVLAEFLVRDHDALRSNSHGIRIINLVFTLICADNDALKLVLAEQKISTVIERPFLGFAFEHAAASNNLPVMMTLLSDSIVYYNIPFGKLFASFKTAIAQGNLAVIKILLVHPVVIADLTPHSIHKSLESAKLIKNLEQRDDILEALIDSEAFRAHMNGRRLLGFIQRLIQLDLSKAFQAALNDPYLSSRLTLQQLNIIVDNTVSKGNTHFVNILRSNNHFAQLMNKMVLPYFKAIHV